MAIPKIPDDAPFSAEQRAWLNDYFAKLVADFGSAKGAVAAGPAVPVTVLVGSQTGTSESTAKKLAKAMKKRNLEPNVVNMADYDHDKLATEENVLIITSTYGDGEPPDNAAELHEWLHSDAAPRLDKTRFSVLALGDREYPDFCECGIEFDLRFEALGAERIFPRVDCDVDFDDEYAQWSEGVIDFFAPAAGAVVDNDVEQEDDGFTKSNPFPARILRNYNLNAPESEKATHHIEISLEGSDLNYEVGDALGLYPRNDETVVDEIIEATGFKANEIVPNGRGEETTLREALIASYDIRSLNKGFLENWQKNSHSPFLRALVQGGTKEQIDDFCWGRELIDLIIHHPADFPDAEEFVGALKKLQPRLYSISSSPKAHPGEVHLTVGVVSYDAHDRVRGGVCSTYLAHRVEDTNPGVYLHANAAFRPPSGDKDLIMVGPGTGIAPFRAFLEEREATEATGRSWLLFGNPHEATDFLYKDELEAMQEKGVLTKLTTAFSRDQEQKVYVQNRMVEHADEMWGWLNGGATFAVCGDASRMAKDVDKALHTIAETAGGLSPEAAVEWVKNLKKEKRYIRDVY